MDFTEAEQNNQDTAEKFIQAVRPDVYLLMKQVDSGGLNLRILLSVIRNLYNIFNGTRFGKVIIEVENGQVTFVRGEESERIGEQIARTTRKFDTVI